jgi:phosphoglycolate phosphatase
MFEACKIASVKPEQCVYIGDACHDITAGKNANMKTLVALYGYLQETDQPENWGADAMIEQPEFLLNWINTSLCH